MHTQRYHPAPHSWAMIATGEPTVRARIDGQPVPVGALRPAQIRRRIVGVLAARLGLSVRECERVMCPRYGRGDAGTLRTLVYLALCQAGVPELEVMRLFVLVVQTRHDYDRRAKRLLSDDRFRGHLEAITEALGCQA